MTDDVKFVVIEHRPDGTILLRGYGLLTVLAQFHWAQRHPAGALIPVSRLATASGALVAAGYTTASPDTPHPRRRQPLPLPECAQCTQPLRRARHYPDHCPHCGTPLTVLQADPDWEPDHDANRANCAHHPHGAYQIWPMATYQHPELE